MKSIAIGLTLAALISTSAFAAPYKQGPSRITGYERAKIAESAARLAVLKRRAWADGRLSFSERFQIRNAEARHAALVARARHS